MTREYFNNSVKPIIENCIKRLTKVDSGGCKCLFVNNKHIDRVYYYYEQKRHTIRSYFMKTKQQPMDRHKIGAVLMYAVLKSHIFKIQNLDKQKFSHQLIMSNEYLAVYVALSVVESYRRNDLKNTPNEWRLFMPPTHHSKAENAYIDNLCKSLYYVPNISKFDIFAYANILFLLEEYTDMFESSKQNTDHTNLSMVADKTNSDNSSNYSQITSG